MSLKGNNNKNIGEELIKFTAPEELKRALQELANERNITLSSLLRLIASEYVKRNRGI
jgi:predicted transcriptional regulator